MQWRTRKESKNKGRRLGWKLKVQRSVKERGGVSKDICVSEYKDENNM